MEDHIKERQFGSPQSHKDTLAFQVQEMQANSQYYQQYKALRQDSKLMYQNFLNVQKRHKNLQNRIQNLVNKANNFKDFLKPVKQQKKKNVRRGLNEILKKFNCPFPKCNRSYASRCSYRFHLKIKHPEQYASKKGADSSISQLVYK